MQLRGEPQTRMLVFATASVVFSAKISLAKDVISADASTVLEKNFILTSLEVEQTFGGRDSLATWILP